MIAVSKPMATSPVGGRRPRSRAAPLKPARRLAPPRPRACSAMVASPPVSRPTTAVLPAAQLVEVELRLAEADAVLRQVGRLVDHPRDVQQRLRRDAADVEADAAEGRRSARPGRPSCPGRRRGRRRCSRRGRRRGPGPRRGGRRRGPPGPARASAAGASSRSGLVRVFVGGLGVCGLGWASCRRRSRLRSAVGSGAALEAAVSPRLRGQDQIALADLVADLDLDLLDDARRAATARPSTPCRSRA